jgi:hypothetical protein
MYMFGRREQRPGFRQRQKAEAERLEFRERPGFRVQERREAEDRSRKARVDLDPFDSARGGSRESGVGSGERQNLQREGR